MGVGVLFVGVVRQQEWLGGEMGIAGIPEPPFGKTGLMLMALAAAAVTAAFSLYLKRSWMGFAFDAIAADEDTARVVAIDVARYKLAAFALGTGIAGVAGGLYALNLRFLAPDSFDFLESVTVLALVVIGGIGPLALVQVAAAVLAVLPQGFHAVGPSAEEC